MLLRLFSCSNEILAFASMPTTLTASDRMDSWMVTWRGEVSQGLDRIQQQVRGAFLFNYVIIFSIHTYKYTIHEYRYISINGTATKCSITQRLCT
jgi:hypothetical protein